MIEKFLFIIGGLFLFIYGINLLSFHLTKINKNKINFLINKAKKNNLSALVIGILITTIFQSSSAVSVILIAFITSKLLDLKSACFILMGANIGSTITGILASIKSSKEAKKLAAFNFFFNLSTALFIFVFFEFISSKTKDFINYFSFSSSNTITFLHFVFNLLGIFIWSIFDALFELKKKINSNKLIKKEI